MCTDVLGLDVVLDLMDTLVVMIFVVVGLMGTEVVALTNGVWMLAVEQAVGVIKLPSVP